MCTNISDGQARPDGRGQMEMAIPMMGHCLGVPWLKAQFVKSGGRQPGLRPQHQENMHFTF